MVGWMPQPKGPPMITTHAIYANASPAPSTEGLYWAKRPWWEEIEPVSVCRTFHNSDLRVATIGHDHWFPVDDFIFFGPLVPLKESKFNG